MQFLGPFPAHCWFGRVHVLRQSWVLLNVVTHFRRQGGTSDPGVFLVLLSSSCLEKRAQLMFQLACRGFLHVEIWTLFAFRQRFFFWSPPALTSRTNNNKQQQQLLPLPLHNNSDNSTTTQLFNYSNNSTTTATVQQLQQLNNSTTATIQQLQQQQLNNNSTTNQQLHNKSNNRRLSQACPFLLCHLLSMDPSGQPSRSAAQRRRERRLAV